MEFEEAKRLVLEHLEKHGQAKNSELRKLCGGDRDLYEDVREELLCPTPGCDMRLRVNPFVVKASPMSARP
jgi:hypothetical protein